MARMFVTLDKFGNRDVILLIGRKLYERCTIGNPGIYLGINYRDTTLTIDETAELITNRLANNCMTVDEIADGVKTLEDINRVVYWKQMYLPAYQNEFYFDVIKRYYIDMSEIMI